MSVTLMAGCSSGPAEPPTDAGKCHWASKPRGADVAVVAGLYWLPGSPVLGTSKTAYICVGGAAGSTVLLSQTGAQLTIEPATTILPASGVVPVRVTAAAANGKTTLELQRYDKAGLALHLEVAVVVADRTHWHFKRAG